MAKDQVSYRDVDENQKEIQRNMAVLTALLKRKNYAPEELRRINQAMGGAITLVNKAIAFARKLGESVSQDLLDRIDNRIDELDEETEYQKFFKKKLAEWGVSSPAELSDEDKKKFFAEVEKEWTGEKNGS
jgi:dsRNA-specific ribonuclease